ncbi:MAG: hypothetical protein ACE14M_04680 [Terriglobales bacterium]
MNAPATALGTLNRVVVASLDGARWKGHICNFSPLKDSFDLLPVENPLHSRGSKLELKNLKAIFFVKDHTGNAAYKPDPAADASKHGRRIEAEFPDGEKIRGVTEAYNPQKPGFFMFPLDEKDNNVRIFVINRNVRKIKFL